MSLFEPDAARHEAPAEVEDTDNTADLVTQQADDTKATAPP